jgi:quinol monooxygenase YgiN
VSAFTARLKGFLHPDTRTETKIQSIRIAQAAIVGSDVPDSGNNDLEVPMNSRGLLVRMHSKPGQENAVEAFLNSALHMVKDEPDTTAWFAVRFGRGEYGIVDVFPDDAARDAHLAGPVSAALKQRAGELFEGAPKIQKLDVIADKLPVVSTAPDTKGLLLTFKAKPGHQLEVEEFLRQARELVDSERNTTAWLALHTEDGEYGIFDVFPANEDRFMHLMGRVPRELAKHAFKMLGSMPELEMLNVQAEKIGADTHEVVRH